jgi:hypothetical protein
MPERRFVLVDFTHMSSSTRCLHVYEAGETYTMPRAVAHAAAKHGLVARERPADWSLPSILTSREVLTEADVLEAEAELRALQRHALEVIDSEADN